MLEGRLVISRALALALVMPCACASDDGGGDDDDITAETIAAFEGIYEITTWSEADTGCDGPGSDVLAMATDLHFVLVGSEILGQRILELISCVDVPDCQAKVDALRNQQPYTRTVGATMSEQIAEDELTGFLATTGVERDGVCTEREYEDHTLTRTGETATLTTEIKQLADRPPEDGFCVVDGREAKREGADAPCVGLRVLVGTRVLGL